MSKLFIFVIRPFFLLCLLPLSILGFLFNFILTYTSNMNSGKAGSSTDTLKASPNITNYRGQQLKPSRLTVVISFVLCTTTPFVVIYYWIAYQYFDTSIVTAARVACSEGLFQFFITRFPHSSGNAVFGYAAWLAFQAIMYIYLPGREALGPVTPAGRRLRYKLNGLAAWVATIALWALGAISGIIDPAYIAKNWEGLIWTTNVFSVVVVILFHMKARLMPDNKAETFITGKILLVCHLFHFLLTEYPRLILVRHL
jgi:hypothetical protein